MRFTKSSARWWAAAVTLLFLAFQPRATAAEPAGIGAAGDPVDAMAGAAAELAGLFCTAVRVSDVEALKRIEAEAQKYPRDMPLVLFFRLNYAEAANCVVGFEAQGGRVSETDPGVMYNPKTPVISVRAIGLGPPLAEFPGVQLSTVPPELNVTLGEEAMFEELDAAFTVDGQTFHAKLKPRDAIWASSDPEGLAPVPSTPSETPTMSSTAQRFSSHKEGRYTVTATLPSGAEANAIVSVIPADALIGYWLGRASQPPWGSICSSGYLRIDFDSEGEVLDGRVVIDCTIIIMRSEPEDPNDPWIVQSFVQ
jgi:hypothetical protein